ADRRGHARRGAGQREGDRGLPRRRPQAPLRTRAMTTTTTSTAASGAAASAAGGARAMLRVTGLRVAYGGIQAVKGISFEVREGELVSLIGANGAGKTTTLKAVTGT